MTKRVIEFDPAQRRSLARAVAEDEAVGERTAEEEERRRRSPRRRRRRSAQASPAPGPAFSDRFLERLQALEAEIDEALARAGGLSDRAREQALRDAAEALVRLYVRLRQNLSLQGLFDLYSRLQLVPVGDEVDDFGFDPVFEEFAAPIFRFLYRYWWRVQTFGLENVPATGRVLLVSNHSGGFFAYDAAMIKVALRDDHPAHREARPLVDNFVYHFPYLGTFMTRVGGVRACQENARRLLERDEVIAVFPEGLKGIGKHYHERYRLQRFGRGGFITLALQTGAPIVPVAVVGAEEVHPIIAKWDWVARLSGLPYFPVTPTFPWLGVLGLLPLPTKWFVTFGEAMDLSSTYGPERADDRLLVNRLKEEVRERIQRMLLTTLRRRRSVFFG